MSIKKGNTITVEKFGYVKYLDHMGSDEDIVDAARISYDRKGSSKDRNLIRYLLRNGHTSPFEMAVLKVEMKMPIFVNRQSVRHRTASTNEMSARYTMLPEEFMEFGSFEMQSSDNKQGREAPITTRDQAYCKDVYLNAARKSFEAYHILLNRGVSREQARAILPLSTYTKLVWKIDLHNLLHFLTLRCHPHAQKEIRDFGDALRQYVEFLWPMSAEAWEDYSLNAHKFSAQEMNILRELMQDTPVKKLIYQRASENGKKLSEREWKNFVTALTGTGTL